MRVRLIIIFCFWVHLGFSQIKINLLSPLDSHSDYRFVNIRDTSFVALSHMEDMGVWYGVNYNLKLKIPDGEYEIYVDDKLKLSAFIKESKKDGTWTYYYHDGKVQTIPYKNDLINGEMKEFYKNGTLSYKGTFVNDKAIGVATNFYESGKVQMKHYFENGVYLKREVFNEKGKIESIYYPKLDSTVTK